MDDLRRLVEVPGEPDLIEGALLIAREEYADLDPASWRRDFAKLTDEARARVDAEAPARTALTQFNEHFFGRLGFRGNRDDYYDPRNSYLNDVLERRVGIPITLSLLHVEMGRRLGLPLSGVGFPGRYLVRLDRDGRTWFVDCFEGEEVDRDRCRGLLRELYGGRIELREEMLRPSGARDTLLRMLNNLRAIFARRREPDRALRFVELAMVVDPASADSVRDRGLLHLQKECFGRACEDLADYLRRAPDAEDAGVVREHLDLARKLLARLN